MFSPPWLARDWYISQVSGEPLVLQKNLTLAGVALEDAARTLIGFPGPSTQKGWGNVR